MATSLILAFIDSRIDQAQRKAKGGRQHRINGALVIDRGPSHPWIGSGDSECSKKGVGIRRIARDLGVGVGT
jgi:hypothetical protein